MFSLSQTSSHAIKALTCLADHRCEHTFIQTVSECTGVPRDYLAKIFRRLNEQGIVEAKRGYKGGVWLARPPEEISLLDISVAIDGEDSLSRCLLGDEFCSDARSCPTHAFWKKHRQEIQEELKKTSLADVVKFNKQKGRAVKK